MRTVINDSGAAAGSGQAEALLQGFEGVALDAEAQAAIAAALEACAARARAADAAYAAGGEAALAAAAEDAGESFVGVGDGPHYAGELLPPVEVEDYVPFSEGEAPWQMTGEDMPEALARLVEEREEAERTVTPADPAQARGD